MLTPNIQLSSHRPHPSTRLAAQGRKRGTHASKLWGRWYIEAIDSPYCSGMSSRLQHVVELRRCGKLCSIQCRQAGLDPRADSNETIGDSCRKGITQ